MALGGFFILGFGVKAVKAVIAKNSGSTSTDTAAA
jgi:hypothetical protein